MPTRLQRYLRYVIHGEKSKRSPRRKARRGPRAKLEVSGLDSDPAVLRFRNARMRSGPYRNRWRNAAEASDFSCVPLTPGEHREYHRIGKRAFEMEYGVCFREEVRRLNDVWFRYSNEVK